MLTGGQYRATFTAALLVILGASGCSVFRRPPPPAETGEVGVASYYGPHLHGGPTASGERFDQAALSAAHPSLPLGTRARVTNLANGRSVVVRINDRGPFVDGRAIDLSYAAARRLGMVGRGTARVRIEALRADGSPAVTGQAHVRKGRRGPRRRRAAERPPP